MKIQDFSLASYAVLAKQIYSNSGLHVGVNDLLLMSGGEMILAGSELENGVTYNGFVMELSTSDLTTVDWQRNFVSAKI